MTHLLSNYGPLTRASLGALHIINLATRLDRWVACVNHVRQDLKWDIDMVRHEAVDARPWTHTQRVHEYDKSYLPYVDTAALSALRSGTRTTWQDLTPGAVGCSLSHLALYGLLVAHSGMQHAFICEDDAEWTGARPAHDVDALLAAMNGVPQDWDILLLGGKPIRTFAEYDTYYHVQFFWQMHAYVIRKEAAVKLLIGALPLTEPIDYFVSRRIAVAPLRVYMLKPFLFMQRLRQDEAVRQADSDINTGKPTTDRIT